MNNICQKHNGIEYVLWTKEAKRLLGYWEEQCDNCRAQSSDAQEAFKVLRELLNKHGYEFCSHNAAILGSKRYRKWKLRALDRMMTKKEYAIMQAIPEKLIEEVCHFPDHEGRWNVLARKWWKHMQRLFPALPFRDFMEIAWWKWVPKKIKVKRITCINCGDSFAEGYCWETGGNCERYEEEIEVYDTVKVFGGGEKEYFSGEGDY